MRWYLCGYYTISWFCYVVQSPVDRIEGWDQRLLWDYCLEHVPFYLTLGPSSWEQNGELNGTHNNIREREGWFYRENCQRNPNVSNKRDRREKRSKWRNENIMWKWDGAQNEDRHQLKWLNICQRVSHFTYFGYRGWRITWFLILFCTPQPPCISKSTKYLHILLSWTVFVVPLSSANLVKDTFHSNHVYSSQ